MRSSILLINVLTELIKLIIFALMLALSCMPPKAGSFCVDPHPTTHPVSILAIHSHVSVRHTSREESIFREDGDGVDEEHGYYHMSEVVDYRILSSSPWNKPPKLKKRVAMADCLPSTLPKACSRGCGGET